jgi:hypothetical protein
VIVIGSENYEIINTLESIAKSLENLAESQKKIADTLGSGWQRERSLWIKAGESFWNKEKSTRNGKLRKTENIVDW